MSDQEVSRRKRLGSSQAQDLISWEEFMAWYDKEREYHSQRTKIEAMYYGMLAGAELALERIGREGL